MKRPFQILLPLLLVAWALAPGPPPLAQGDVYIEDLASRDAERRRSVLLSHGVNPTEAALVRFLQEGLSTAARERGLPEEPAAKIDVVNLAIQELGYQRSEAAVPILVQLVEGKEIEGISSVLVLDLEKFPLERGAQMRRDLMGIVRLNSVIALGLIGDPRGVEPVLGAVQREEGRAFITEGAVALGLMGDRRGLAPVADLAKDPSYDRLPGVYATIFYLTGRNYAITDNSPLAVRRNAHEDLMTWLKGEGAAYVASRSDILRRRAGGLQVPDPPIETLRGALRASRNFGDYEARYAGRTRLRTLGPAAAPQMREIALDPLEDLDIRRAAMQWYSAADPKEARDVMRQLARKDENPIIREQAESLEEDIKEMLKKK